MSDDKPEGFDPDAEIADILCFLDDALGGDNMAPAGTAGVVKAALLRAVEAGEQRAYAKLDAVLSEAWKGRDPLQAVVAVGSAIDAGLPVFREMDMDSRDPLTAREKMAIAKDEGRVLLERNGLPTTRDGWEDPTDD